MNKEIKIWSMIGLMAIAGGCNDAPPLPDNLANFETSAVGLTGTEISIKVVLVRAVDADTPLTISLTGSNITYGTQ